jgi:hypothetical protein
MFAAEAESTPAAVTSNAETSPSLGATSADDSTTAARTHANKETMGAFAPDYGRLICAFHGYRLCKRETRNYIFSLWICQGHFFWRPVDNSSRIALEFATQMCAGKIRPSGSDLKK